MLDLSALSAISDLDIPDLQPVAWQPVVPSRLTPPDPDDEPDVFAAIREGDILLHHPYESFTASVQQFIEQAAEDPDVLTIKQTLYRTSGDSPMVRALIQAAEPASRSSCWSRSKRASMSAPTLSGRAAGEGWRPRRLWPGRPEDALEGGLVVRREGRVCAATCTSAPATTTRRRRAVTSTWACFRVTRSWAPM
jgi:hypothetical protein